MSRGERDEREWLTNSCMHPSMKQDRAKPSSVTVNNLLQRDAQLAEKHDKKPVVITVPLTSLKLKTHTFDEFYHGDMCSDTCVPLDLSPSPKREQR